MKEFREWAEGRGEEGKVRRMGKGIKGEGGGEGEEERKGGGEGGREDRYGEL